MKSAAFTFKLAGSSPKDPLSIFHVGQGFFLAGQRCLLQVSVGPGLSQVLPGAGVTNLCFSIELFLKALIVASGKESPKTHKLDELIALQPKGELDSVRALYQQQVQLPTFDELIMEVSQFFVKLRYEYEFDIFSLNDHAVFVLADALYTHCAARTKSQTPVTGMNV